MSRLTLPVSLVSDGRETTRGTAIIDERSLSARVVRAALTAAACFLTALLCVFIPLLHFVLVPGMLLTGVTLLVVRLREDRTLVEVRGPCPRCQDASATMPESGRFQDGRVIRCAQCGDAIALRLTA